jgi:cutinase
MVQTRALRHRRAVVALAAVSLAGAVTAGCGQRPPTGGNAGCSAVELVIARGTSEPGTLGVIVGDPLLRATRQAVAPRSVAGYPVDYPASTDPGSPYTGNRALVAHMTSRTAACPATKFVLVGYSQGAAVVDMAIGAYGTGSGANTVTLLPAGAAARVAAVVLFGNPIRRTGRAVPAEWSGRTLDICAPLDPVCDPNGTDFSPHLTYGNNAGQAAAFIASKV